MNKTKEEATSKISEPLLPSVFYQDWIFEGCEQKSSGTGKFPSHSHTIC